MTQLILDTTGYKVQLPESQKGGYTADEQPLSRSIEMISGRTVKEVRGNVWVISYQFGYFDGEMKNSVLAALKKGEKEPIVCGFLPQESEQELTYSEFFVTSYTRPKFMWSNDGKPLWGDYRIELREVRPHD